MSLRHPVHKYAHLFTYFQRTLLQMSTSHGVDFKGAFISRHVWLGSHWVRGPLHSCACVAVCCSALQCVAVCCRVLQCVAECCNVLQCVAVCLYFSSGAAWQSLDPRPTVLQIVAVCCRVLQYFTECCSMLQYVAVCCSMLQYVAVCCSMLQCY